MNPSLTLPDQPVREASRPTPDHASLAAATATPAARRKALAWSIAVLVIAGGMDTFLAVPAFNGILRGSPWQSFLCAVAFALISLSAAYGSGMMFKEGHRTGGLLAAAAAVLMVVALFFLRVQAASVNSGSVQYEGSGATTDEVGAELGIAVVLALALFATGVLAWIDGYKITLTPAQRLFRSLEERLSRTTAFVASHEGLLVRLNENLTMAELRLRRIPLEREDALRGLDAFERELKELARTEIAVHLGNPTATSGLDLPLSAPTRLDAPDRTDEGHRQ